MQKKFKTHKWQTLGLHMSTSKVLRRVHGQTLQPNRPVLGLGIAQPELDPRGPSARFFLSESRSSFLMMWRVLLKTPNLRNAEALLHKQRQSPPSFGPAHRKSQKVTRESEEVGALPPAAAIATRRLPHSHTRPGFQSWRWRWWLWDARRRSAPATSPPPPPPASYPSATYARLTSLTHPPLRRFIPHRSPSRRRVTVWWCLRSLVGCGFDIFWVCRWARTRAPRWRRYAPRGCLGRRGSSPESGSTHTMARPSRYASRLISPLVCRLDGWLWDDCGWVLRINSSAISVYVSFVLAIVIPWLGVGVLGVVEFMTFVTLGYLWLNRSMQCSHCVSFVLLYITCGAVDSLYIIYFSYLGAKSSNWWGPCERVLYGQQRNIWCYCFCSQYILL